jgi:hypothetical protein
MAQLIEILNENYSKFVNMNAMAMQDFILWTFENCSKIYDCFNPLFINQIQKRTM